jgi:hypothetical protein
MTIGCVHASDHRVHDHVHLLALYIYENLLMSVVLIIWAHQQLSSVTIAVPAAGSLEELLQLLEAGDLQRLVSSGKLSAALGITDASATIEEFFSSARAWAAAALDSALGDAQSDSGARCLVLGAACLTAFIQHNLTG